MIDTICEKEHRSLIRAYILWRFGRSVLVFRHPAQSFNVVCLDHLIDLAWVVIDTICEKEHRSLIRAYVREGKWMFITFTCRSVLVFRPPAQVFILDSYVRLGEANVLHIYSNNVVCLDHLIDLAWVMIDTICEKEHRSLIRAYILWRFGRSVLVFRPSAQSLFWITMWGLALLMFYIFTRIKSCAWII